MTTTSRSILSAPAFFMRQLVRAPVRWWVRCRKRTPFYYKAERGHRFKLIPGEAKADRHEARESSLVTVVIPTYNRAAYIAETIRSVLNQTYGNVEIIVIDDGSTDDTTEVVSQFGDEISFISQENSERGASRNHGLRLAKGEYISFLDSDDVWLPEKVASDVAIFEARPEVGLIFSDAIQIDRGGQDLRRLRSARLSGRVTARLIARNFVPFSTQMMRTALVRQLGGFREERELSGAEDWELLVRLSTITQFMHNPAVTTKIRTHPGNTMNDAATMFRATNYASNLVGIFATIASDFPRSLQRMKANLALANAINHCSISDGKATTRFLWQAFAANPMVISDWRFAYTILRLVRKRLGER